MGMPEFDRVSCIWSPSASRAYRSILEIVSLYGKECSPRDMRIKEIRPVMFRIDGDSRLVAQRSRELSTPLAILEALQLIGGFSLPLALTKIAPQYVKFINPGTGELDGAYGPRVVEQIPYIIRILGSDPDSRQAVITIYDAETDHRTSADVPCTLSLQFFLRDNLEAEHPNGQPERKTLELVVTMRSNDVWLGVPYDVFQFSVLQAALAGEFGAVVGTYTHVSGSMHLYKRDWKKVEKVIGDTEYVDQPPPIGIQPYQRSVEEASRTLMTWWAERMKREKDTFADTGSKLLDIIAMGDSAGSNLSPFFGWCLERLREEGMDAS